MTALRQVEIQIYREFSQQRGQGFAELAKVFGRNEVSFLHKYIIPAVKCVGADLLDFAVPQNADVVSGRKYFKKAAKNVGRQTRRKQLGSGSKKRSASRVIPTKSVK